MEKRFITLAPRAKNRWWHQGQRAVSAALLSAPYWFRARRAGATGLDLHRKSVGLALELFARRAHIPATKLFFMVAWPLDSTRYLELPFALDALESRPVRRYLDVSSPRLLPTLFIRQHPHLQATLINPDKEDLDDTARVLRGIGIDGRCDLHACLAEDIPLASESVDAITSMSVIEHIPEDTTAIRHLWDLLRPGGALIISMPCTARGEEHYLNVNHYGVLQEEGGFTFLQRLYDQDMLESRIFSVTGPPHRQVVFGERCPGFLQQNLREKWEQVSYPFWREPYLMAREFRVFESVTAVPGEGVVAMEFVKA